MILDFDAVAEQIKWTYQGKPSRGEKSFAPTHTCDEVYNEAGGYGLISAQKAKFLVFSGERWQNCALRTVRLVCGERQAAAFNNLIKRTE